MPKISDVIGQDFAEDITQNLLDGTLKRTMVSGWEAIGTAIGSSSVRPTYYRQASLAETPDPNAKDPFPFTDDAYWDTCNFMSAAMERDAGSEEARVMRNLNKRIDSESDYDPAKALFFGLVREGSDWDYKYQLLNRHRLLEAPFRYKQGTFFGTTIPRDREFVYYYDIWGNIHYGYVGRHCGFSEETLLGYAQLQDRFAGNSSSERISDTLSIELGFKLFKNGTCSSGVITGELEFIKNFWVEGIVKHRPENLILQTMTPKQEKQQPGWYRIMV